MRIKRDSTDAGLRGGRGAGAIVYLKNLPDSIRVALRRLFTAC